MPSVSQLIGGHEPSTIGIKEQKLNEIVNAIGSCSYKTMKDLGFAMGFQKVDIDQYVASNHQNGTVSLRGITDMVFAWKSKTSPANQMRLLREALLKAELIEIADTYLPKNGRRQSVELLCKKCDRVTAKITNVINTKRSDSARRSKVRNIMGRECLVQLMDVELNKVFDNRYDVITLTTADVEVDDKLFPNPGGFEGYKEHRGTWCKGCSEQVGCYIIPTDGSLAPFHALFLQCLIHDSYDSDNSLNVFFAQTL